MISKDGTIVLISLKVIDNNTKSDAISGFSLRLSLNKYTELLLSPHCEMETIFE